MIHEEARGILGAALKAPVETRRLDVEDAVRTVARVRPLQPPPFARIPALAPHLQLRLDRCEAMLPFLADLDALTTDMKRIVGEERLEVLDFAGRPDRARRGWSSPYGPHVPPPGTCVVLATDLGIGAPPASDLGEWLTFAHRLRSAGCRAVAFVPYGPDQWPAELLEQVILIHWDRSTTAGRAAAFARDRRGARRTRSVGARSQRQRDEEASRLACVASFAVRVDPALLRALRVGLFPQADAGIEAAVWSSPMVRFRGPDGFVFEPTAADLLRQKLAADDPRAYERAWRTTEALHRHLPAAIRLEEELRYLHRSGREDAGERIAELLRGTVATMVSGRDDLAPWAARAIADLPSDLGDPEDRSMVAVAAQLRLSDQLVRTPSLPAEGLPEWVAWITPTDIPTVKVGVALLDGALELSEPPAEGAHVIEIPVTRPLAIEASLPESGSPRWRVDFEPGSTKRIRFDGNPIIRTSLGREWSLTRASTPDRPLDERGVLVVDLHTHYPMHLVPSSNVHQRIRSWSQKRVRGRVVDLVSRIANYQGPGDEPGVTVQLLREGGVGVALSVLYSPFDEMDLSKEYGAPPRAAYYGDLIAQLEDVELDIAARSGSAEVVRDLEALERCLASGILAIIHAVEGGFHLGADPDQIAANVEDLAHRGVAYVTLAHLFWRGIATNAPALPYLPDWLYRRLFPQPAIGLSDLGEALVRAMVKHDLLIDVTHMSEQALSDTFTLLDELDPDRNHPVIASHIACRFGGLAYNVADATIARIAERGGVLGVIDSHHFVADGRGRAPESVQQSIDLVSAHIDHIAAVTGSFDHAALGTDLDGYVKPALAGLEHAGRLRTLAEGLVERYGPDRAAKVCSDNALRVLRAALADRPTVREASV